MKTITLELSDDEFQILQKYASLQRLPLQQALRKLIVVPQDIYRTIYESSHKRPRAPNKELWCMRRVNPTTIYDCLYPWCVYTSVAHEYAKDSYFYFISRFRSREDAESWANTISAQVLAIEDDTSVGERHTCITL